MMGVPTHAIDILAEHEAPRHTDARGVEVFYMAGSPIPPRSRQRFVEQGVKPQNVYGMTENSLAPIHASETTQPRPSSRTCGRGWTRLRGAYIRPR